VRFKIGRKCRNSFVLAETIIALILASLFISMSLSFFYMVSRYTTHQTTLLDESSQQCQKQIAIRRILSNIQLKNVPALPKIHPADAFSKSPKFTFYYNNGTDTEPEFSDVVPGMIYLDVEGRLVLVTSSPPQKDSNDDPEERAEVLCSNVEMISWRCAFTPNASELQIETKDENGWFVNPVGASWNELKAVRLLVWEKESKNPSEPSFLVTCLVASHINPLKIE